MSEVTINQLASDVGIPVDRLLRQLGDAGIDKSSAEDIITEQEKVTLLNHLRRSHGKDEAKSKDSPRKITLRRKTTTELKQSSGARPSIRGGGRRARPRLADHRRRRARRSRGSSACG